MQSWPSNIIFCTSVFICVSTHICVKAYLYFSMSKLQELVSPSLVRSLSLILALIGFFWHSKADGLSVNAVLCTGNTLDTVYTEFRKCCSHIGLSPRNLFCLIYYIFFFNSSNFLLLLFTLDVERRPVPALLLPPLIRGGAQRCIL